MGMVDLKDCNLLTEIGSSLRLRVLFQSCIAVSRNYLLVAAELTVTLLFQGQQENVSPALSLFLEGGHEPSFK